MPGRYHLKCRLAGMGLKFLGAVEDLLAPPICTTRGCYSKRWRSLPLCLRCIRRLRRFPATACNRCGREDCQSGHEDWEHSFQSVHTLFYFNLAFAEVIHGLKYRAFRRHGLFLTGFVRYYSQIIAKIQDCDMLLPVPLYFLRQRERGFNQALVIAKVLSVYCGIPVFAEGLKRVRNTRSQTRLTEKQRAENMEGAFKFSAKVSFKGKKVFLVDDVYTTGATTEACANVLLKAGASEVRVFTLARAMQDSDIDDYRLELELAGSFVT